MKLPIQNQATYLSMVLKQRLDSHEYNELRVECRELLKILAQIEQGHDVHSLEKEFLCTVEGTPFYASDVADLYTERHIDFVKEIRSRYGLYLKDAKEIADTYRATITKTDLSTD